jgi:hypothetical protein
MKIIIHQFSRSPQLQDILKSVDKDPYKYSYEEIITTVDQFLPSQNCEGAALGYFSIISHICYFRSDLEKPLMKIAIKPLYYLGLTDPENEIKWVQSYVKKKSLFQNNYYFTSKQGENWIQNEFITKLDTVEAIIKEIVIEDSIENEM